MSFFGVSKERSTQIKTIKGRLTSDYPSFALTVLVFLSSAFLSMGAPLPDTAINLDPNSDIVLYHQADFCSLVNPTTNKYFTPLIEKGDSNFFLHDHQNIKGLDFKVKADDRTGDVEQKIKVYLSAKKISDEAKDGTSVFHVTVGGGGAEWTYEIQMPGITCYFPMSRKDYISSVKVFYAIG
jgi:hypothetical protein